MSFAPSEYQDFRRQSSNQKIDLQELITKSVCLKTTHIASFVHNSG